MQARRVFTARGETLTTEAHDDCCWDSEEIAAAEVDVEEGTLCDICEEEITDKAPKETEVD